MESIGFKEWAVVCDALAQGKQTVILRKGGIAEGRAGFAFRHPEFFLFPTFFHGQVAMLRTPGPALTAPQEGQVEIQCFAKIEFAQLVTDWEKIAALEPFHVLNAPVVRERFAYDGHPGIHVAFVRAYRLSPCWTFPHEPRFGGCRSWLKLPDTPTSTQFERVLPEPEHAARLAEFRSIVAAPADESYASAST